MDSAKNTNNKEFITVDLAHLFKSLWRKAWLIALSAVLTAVIGFSYATFFITPNYSASIMLYVNNSSFSFGSTSFSFSSSELLAAQSLVKTYSVILKNRTTLERVIEKADVDYSYEELNAMISAASEQNTEVLKVTVTGTDAEEAAKIANCIAEVLPQRISEIIDGSTMEIVDVAVPDHQKVSPSIAKYTVLGFLVGLALCIAILVIAALMDDTVHDEEYILQNYQYPILAKVPNLIDGNNNNYGYYNYKSKKTKAGNK